MVLMYQILCSSDSVVAQKKFIFIFVRIIISLEKNPRKPASILREEIRDFKLLKHIKLLVTDSSVAAKQSSKSFKVAISDFKGL